MIDKFEVSGSGLRISEGLSEATEFVVTQSSDGETLDGPLRLSWVVPAKSEQPNALSAILLMSNLNLSAMSQIWLVIEWHKDSNRSIRREHKSKMAIKLTNDNRQRATNAHAEISL